MCGCGERTAIATCTDKHHGWAKGEPKKFMPGHQRRKSHLEYVIKDCGYETPCWVWQRSQNSDGYGQMRIHGRLLRAHVVYWERENGPVPEGRDLHHRCEVPSCVNPAHTTPLSRSEHSQAGGRAKLSAVEVRAIRVRYAAGGITQRELAVEYGVGHTTIGALLLGQTWTNIGQGVQACQA
jgi:hypothetical protein